MILGLVLYFTSAGDLVLTEGRFRDAQTCSSVVEGEVRRLQALQKIAAFGQCFDVGLGLPVSAGINGAKPL